MADLAFVCCYLDDCLTITKGDYDDHLSKLEQVLERISQAGLCINLPRSNFATQELEYLGYHLSPTGFRPLAKKVEAILRLKRPKTTTDLRRFLGIVQYYRDMWKRRSHILAPLTALTKGAKRKPIHWNHKLQKAFDNIKQVVSKETMLSFPDFSKTFDVHTDASDFQLGGVISQEGRPIAFYSRKLTDTQQKYTTGEREMLSIVETLKEYRNILLGQKIRIHTDHMNNIRPTTRHASARIARWRWLLEEFGAECQHVIGTKNSVADALSRLDADFQHQMDEEEQVHIAESFDIAVNDSKLNRLYPMSAQNIAEYQ